jgi:hypothetical protein
MLTAHDQISNSFDATHSSSVAKHSKSFENCVQVYKKIPKIINKRFNFPRKDVGYHNKAGVEHQSKPKA